MSQMPAFGRDGILTAQVQDVVSHVRVISGQEKPSASAQRGAKIFAENCVVCHGANGEGNRMVGAPKLSDAIWLYGGDRATLTETVTNARYGVMPAWGARLDPVTVKMLAAYVHSLGGGEATPAPAPKLSRHLPPRRSSSKVTAMNAQDPTLGADHSNDLGLYAKRKSVFPGRPTDRSAASSGR
jgi:mono/diheme cytochrome c family protein